MLYSTITNFRATCCTVQLLILDQHAVHCTVQLLILDQHAVRYNY